MCKVCKSAFKVSTTDFLAAVAAAVVNGDRTVEHFKDVLDAVLDTKTPEVDAEADAAYESKYKDG
jgi:hypothetical protein